ncbi:iron ABC transporter permease [Glutamicibacter halophytocola]|uniref:Iron ABC transporter permease n=1 Tax=Glutamicibacter halophytocola TaxID=1933880 RepID=A0AA94XVC1_9MICC|nr:iron ABC transporter permease [Glutamicibacter halophytocola]UUX58877.1 iron ABC transporter permease [Glutamicibacter halophytocola]
MNTAEKTAEPPVHPGNPAAPAREMQPLAVPANGTHLAAGAGVLATLLAAVLMVGAWHLTQGTSGIGLSELLRALIGDGTSVGGVQASEIFTGSRLPRLCAGAAVGLALGVAGSLLQSVTRNPLASPDTLAVTSGAYFALCIVAALGLSLSTLVSSAVAFAGGLLAAGTVLALAGRSTGGATTRLILAGSAIAMALEAGSGMILLLFKENTTGLYAWGSGSLAQLNLDAFLRSLPVMLVALAMCLLLSRRLDVLSLGDDNAMVLGVPVRSTRILALLCAVLLTGVSVSLAGPIAFVGLGAPVLARLLSRRLVVLRRQLFLLPATGLIGALLILLADVVLRTLLGAQGAASIPTGVPTAVLGGVLIVILALRLPEASHARNRLQVASALHSRWRFAFALALGLALLIVVAVLGLLSGSIMLRLGDLALWFQDAAPALIERAFSERAPRTTAALCAGAALGLAGCLVQGTVRNPLAEPGILGITAGAGLGAAIVVTVFGGSRSLLVIFAVVAGLATFALVASLAWRRGFSPERFVLIGIGTGYALSALTTYLLLSINSWETPRIYTWLAGSSYGREFADVIPVAIMLLLALPIVLLMSRTLDLLAVDEDLPTTLGVATARTRLVALALAAVLAALSVVAIGVVGFVGLVAPHLARSLVGSRHHRLIPVSILFGAFLVALADALGRTIIAPAQIPAGLVVSLLGTPYFIWLLYRSRG